MAGAGARPRLAVWKFASCDGCQMSILDCEDELLALTAAVEVAFFPEASRAMAPGPYDLSLVEGSISTPADLERIRRVREESAVLVTIGACATSGGIQALRNATDLGELSAAVYPEPSYLDTLATSTPVADHVRVDAELRGCPIDPRQLLELVTATLVGRKPQLPRHSVCVECKLRGTPCVLVGDALPCLGPVTQAGCGAICPAFHRACYGCFGSMETPNTSALAAELARLGVSEREIGWAFRGVAGADPAFAGEAGRHDG